MPKWWTIAAISRYHNRGGVVKVLPFTFGDGVRLDDAPDWLREHPFVKFALGWRENALLGPNQLALIAEYEASSSGELQNQALQKLFFVNLAAWLSKPTAFNIVFYAHASHAQDGWQPTTYDSIVFRPLKENENTSLVLEDLEMAKQIYSALAGLVKEETLWTTSLIALEALQAKWSVLRFILFWIVLESLFGADQELRYKLAMRLAFFHPSLNGIERQKLYERMMKSYDLRSKIVHGMRVEKIKDEFASVVCETEAVVRESLKKILLDRSLISIFNGKQEKRDEYLQNAMFKALG